MAAVIRYWNHGIVFAFLSRTIWVGGLAKKIRILNMTIETVEAHGTGDTPREILQRDNGTVPRRRLFRVE